MLFINKLTDYGQGPKNASLVRNKNVAIKSIDIFSRWSNPSLNYHIN